MATWCARISSEAIALLAHGLGDPISGPSPPTQLFRFHSEHTGNNPPSLNLIFPRSLDKKTAKSLDCNLRCSMTTQVIDIIKVIIGLESINIYHLRAHTATGSLKQSCLKAIILHQRVPVPSPYLCGVTTLQILYWKILKKLTDGRKKQKERGIAFCTVLYISETSPL